VRLAAEHLAGRRPPVAVPGPSTAAAAREAGFAVVAEAASPAPAALAAAVEALLGGA
jgi:uroporphyrinogen-III synthase